MMLFVLNNLFFIFLCKCLIDDIILMFVVGNIKYFLKMFNKMYFFLFLLFWLEFLI